MGIVVRGDHWKSCLEAGKEPTTLRLQSELRQEVGHGTFVASLSTEISEKFYFLNGTHHVTWESLFENVWALLLSRYSGEEDVLFGSTFGTSGVPLPVRIKIEEETGAAQWMQQLHAEREAVRDQLTATLEEIREWCQIAEGEPLFEIGLFLNEELGDLRLPLALIVRAGQQYQLEFVYERTQFAPDAIERMANHFQNLLRAILEQPEQKVADLSLLTLEEQRLIDAWTDTQIDYRNDVCLHQLFEEQVARRPDAIAAVWEEQVLTYRELNERANLVAHRLRELGVEADSLVGLCVERSFAMLIAMLGILKTGGGYVALDPEYPTDRLALMIEDASLKAVLTTRQLAERLPATEAHLLLLEEIVSSAMEAGDPDRLKNLPCHTASDHLACVIYTSGSTGRPKGVGILHRAISRLVKHTDYLNFTVEDRVAQVSNSAFDAATFEIWGALLNGARAVILSKETLLDPPRLAAAIKRYEVSTMLVTTALFNQLVDAVPEMFQGMRNVLFGGEAGDPNRVRTLLKKGGPERLLNAYGPTESTTIATCHLIEELAEEATAIPIGKPIANTTLYVLDRRMRPVPIGVPGELYIGGDGLARGYLNRADLTAEKFVPHPFSSDPQARLYKTGDAVRYLADGNLEFIGRIDFQVKIRGFRIELGEIEEVIKRNPYLRDVLVLAREDVPGEKRLTGYLVPIEGTDISFGEMRDYLKKQLPAYMVPSAFVMLDSLPLTPNGKVDRKSLPVPDWSAIEVEEAYIAPRTEAERALAAIWSDVLHRERVGASDNFLELGGHSLLATQLISRVRQELGVELTYAHCFEFPVLSEMAALLGAQMKVAANEQIAVSRGETIPLSFAQKRLWFMHEMHGENPMYNLPYLLRLSGLLDKRALAFSLDQLVARHEVLRTTFAAGGSDPVQRVRPAEAVRIDEFDLREVSESEREAQAAALVAELGARPIDLVAGPVFSAALIQLAAEEHLLLLLMHHISADGWSMGVLARELSIGYSHLANGSPLDYPALPIQYADYAIWQQEHSTAAQDEQQLAYWQERLAGELPVLALPTDHPRPAVFRYRGATERYGLSAELTAKLQALSKRMGTSLYMTLLAAYNTLLARYSGQQELIVGTPIAGRNRTDLEGLIGFFVNMLPLRIDLSEVSDFPALLEQVREVTLGAYAHQDIPFERMVELAQQERDLSRTPLFQAVLILQNLPEQSWQLPGLQMRAEAVEHRTAKFDLMFSLEEIDGKLDGFVEYNSDLFAAQTIQRMIGSWQLLLEAICEDSAKPLHAYPLMTAQEEQQLLGAWNETESGYPRELCVHQLFEQQVQRTPEAIAAVWEGRSLTYRELNEQANRVAYRLRELGVQAESLVGLSVERSFDMLIGMVGILKAGGAYVPLDPEYPAERLALMIEDAELAVVITTSELSAQLPQAKAEWLLLDEVRAEQVANRENIPCQSTADHLAYVIYTSGSTGRPKGAGIPHRAIVRLVRDTNYVQFTATDKVAQVSNASFDAATFEIWGALLNGARVVILSKDTLLNPPQLLQAVREQEIDTMFVTTSLFNQLVDEVPEMFQGMRDVLVGGEACDPKRMRALLEKAAPQRLLNAYGPTESTTFAAWFQIEAVPEDLVSIPIGKPLSNTTLYVLDRQMQPVPIGVPGELYIGGDGLAKGYLNRPELTAEKFVPHPFSPDPQARLYKTGDAVRYLPDGNIEYLGRIDFQVKIRGFRIELGEIEDVLKRHELVRDALAMAREDVAGEKRLTVYAVPVEAADLSSEELSDYLKQTLPAYMVPSAIVMLDSLPLTPNGKVDRRALPVPELNRGAEEMHVEPRTDEERVLATIWSELLGVEQIGVHDNFFDLGGHSLLATRLISHIRRTFGVELPLKICFEAPTVEEMCHEIRKATEEVVGDKIVPIARNQQFPLSFAQQRLWFMAQYDPNSPMYSMPYLLRMRGDLDLPALERSLAEIVRRHEALRTTFATVEDHPVQVFHEQMPVSLTLHDLSAQPDQQRADRADRLLRELARTPFDLEKGPLWRVDVARLTEREHWMLLNMHHIVSDGWSISIFADELSKLYGQHAGGEAAQLPELQVQYADFSVWQRDWLQGEVRKQQADYWQAALGGELPVLNLPTDRLRPAKFSHRGAYVPFALSAELTQKLIEQSKRANATLFMTLLSAFNLLLSRYSGQEDIVVGTPIAGRNRVEIEGLIGFFVNMLPIRTDLAGAGDFHELVERVREVTLSAFTYQDMPFEQLVELVQAERDPSRTPLFQAVMMLQNMEENTWNLPGLSLELQPFEGGTSKFDLSFSLTHQEDQLTGTVEYCTDLFEAETILRMIMSWQTLLEAVCDDPTRPLHAYPLLAPEAERQMIGEWNETQRDYPRDLSLQQLFEQQAACAPDAIAAMCDDRSITYRELNERANIVAHRLRKAGVMTESLVGLCIERSFEMLVGLLGILKAGGVYVPLDPDYPTERLALMIEDAELAVIVSDRKMAPLLPPSTAELLLLDQIEQEMQEAGAERENPPCLTTGDHLAYVIYTSGSTGRPKGVCITQRAIARLVLNNDYLTITPEDRISQGANSAFDAAIFEIWGALLHGARMVMLTKEILLNPAKLTAEVDRQQLNILFVTTALFNQLVDEVPEMLGERRAVLFGGEACDPKRVRSLLEQGGPERLLHMYGPTESTTYATWHLIEEVPAGALTVPIGKPIANTTAYVLDSHQQPVPIGVPGELYLGGDGLARGYYNRPELTAEKFVPHPFSSDPQARLYRTGDSVRFLADGSIEFIGRIDYQVKIRGFRIELGEIEEVLLRHELVRDAIVLAREDVPGDKRLVAYVVADEEPEAVNQQLRVYLKAQLPPYMVPSAIVALRAFPLTANGKVDRRALPEPAHERLGSEFTAPQTAQELQLAAIWSDLLRVDPVGIHDNFFELGGHSLLATQLISRMRHAFAIELPLSACFDRPTIAEMSQLLEPDRSERLEEQIGRQERGVILPMSFAQQRLWFMHQLDPDSPMYNMPHLLRLQGRLDLSALKRSLDQLLDRHESLRTAFAADGDQPRQIVLATGSQRMQVIDLSYMQDMERQADVERLLQEEANRRFDLTAGPLFTVLLIRLAEEEHLLLLNKHHIISDGWSFSVLTRELSALYEAEVTGAACHLDPLPIQYTDFAIWQRNRLQGEVIDRLHSYWQEQLGGELPILDLQTDRPRPPVLSYRGAVLPFELSENVTAQLVKLSREAGATLFMTLLAAFNTLLYRYTGQEDIVVGSPIAGRNRAELEGLIGFFVNMLPLRTDLSGDVTFRELIGRVRKTTLDAYAHQEVPFEQLVDLLKVERDPSRSPLFQAVMILQNIPDQTWHLPGLTMQQEPYTGQTSKFDLTFSMQESGERIGGMVEYNTDLYDRETVARMIEHWQMLLLAIAEDSDRPIHRLSMLGAEERQTLLSEWSKVESDYPKDSCVHELFEAQVKRTPDRPAVFFGAEQLTYQELNERANRLARRLRSKGVGPDRGVGISVERSFDLIVGMLGILKAGGAYVPLDPEYPQQRLAMMIEDAELSIVLTQEKLLADLPPTSAEMICLDRDWAWIEQEDGDDLSCQTGPEQLVYVIYTSGSTGRPKGVSIPHRAVNRLVKNTNFAQFEQTDRIGQVANSAFDAATYEIWGALLNGGSLVILPKEVVLQPQEFATAIREQGITSMFLTVALFNQMAQSVPDAFGTMRDLIVGGDALDPKWVKEVLRSGGPERLLNGYGPTESTTFAVWHLIEAVPEGAVSIPIGRPLANTELYVLDRNLQPVPIGVPGELYIGGDGLALGYLNRPELTEERFIPHPFTSDRSARLYKTGDRVRYLADGNIEFIGRVDFQVKIRGFRIEPGEVKEVLLHHADVQDALVMVREDRPGDKRLVAYVVTTGAESATSARLRVWLKDKLPAYLVPSAIVVVESFLLTPNGKVDRQALPKPEDVQIVAEAGLSVPQAGLEHELVSIWREVLQVERVGLDDNFFDLGGHSLLLTTAHQKIQAAVGRTFPLVTMFKHSTIRSLMSYLGHDAESRPAVAKRSKPRLAASDSSAVAIIGMSGRFPDANDVEQFWQNIVGGVESVQFFPEAKPALDIPGMVMAGAMLDRPEEFDPEFFGMSQAQAELTDPQQRLLLECAWEALESAGYNPRRGDERIALYAASGENTYSQLVFANPSVLENPDNILHVSWGNDSNFLTTRISYLLNLRGPSLSVQTACTGSAVAIHLACKSLLAGECDMALAGGTNVKVPQKQGYLAFEGGPYSVDGRNCKPFDATTAGAFTGEAVGTLLLKRLEDAQNDGDTIHAVFRGTAINNDGAEKVGYMALSMEGIERVVTEAIEQAGIEPSTVTAITAHGMGTPLGDAIEATALTQAYAAEGWTPNTVALHSIKPNIGHTAVSAGVANVIQTVMALKAKTLPPTLHFEQPNPQIDFANSPLYVSAAAREWKTADGVPRRAGINSFAMGGTNAHLILEEAPVQQSESSERNSHLLILSAKTPSALQKMAQRLADHLTVAPEIELADVAYTLQLGRAEFEHRFAVRCATREEAIERLQAPQQEIDDLDVQKWLLGETVDWTAQYAEERRRRIPLPTYPFEKRACLAGQ
ncbi:amino acid adenylation domain-containing protein [Tumebacillus lipolyticus]|uniref:Amino acid adenylation domain-containing protein n=1 Tax=Tumebacillus lipolyticus TaxID=1280370 RepID=A0ABW4ZYG5_9BACL